jgi:hypothetical protein
VRDSTPRWWLWLAVGASLIGVAGAFFGVIAYRDSRTLHHGQRTSGEVVGFVSSHAWDPFDNGRLVVRYSLNGQERTARVWTDDGVKKYSLGQTVPVFVRGSHVRTDAEPDDPAHWGSAALVLGLVGLGSVARGLAVRSSKRAPSEGRLGALVWWLGVPAVCALLVPATVSDVHPAFEAHRGHGTPGVFVATEESCGKGGCDYSGDFRSDDGRVTRQDVQIASGSKVNDVGDEVRAVDTGSDDNVYPAGGGHEYLYVVAILVLLAGLVALWLASLVVVLFTPRGSWLAGARSLRSGSRPRRGGGGRRRR